MANATTVLAQTFGWDREETKDYRYQDTRTGKLHIFTVGDCYFTVSKTKPTWDDMEWREYSDQFWAKRNNTVVWVAKARAV